MTIATWNVNGIRARHTGVLAWLNTHTPDICLLQELRCEEDQFPLNDYITCGYTCAVYGQKARNGVAILARGELSSVSKGFHSGFDPDTARLITAQYRNITFLCVYVPNGMAPGTPAFAYKRDFLRELHATITHQYASNTPLVLAGDFNVAPHDNDVYDPIACEDALCCHPDERADLDHLMSWGFTDALRLHHPHERIFSWWDYRHNSFAQNTGLRLDLILLSKGLAQHCTACEVDRETRAKESPSDHAPVIATLNVT